VWIPHACYAKQTPSRRKGSTVEDLTKRIVELKESGKGFAEIGRELNKPASTVRDRYSRWVGIDSKPAQTRASSVGLSVKLSRAQRVDDFLKPFDWMERLRDGLRALPQGSVIKDDDFRRDLQIPDAKWAIVKRVSEFCKYQLRVGPTSQLIWAQPATLEKVRRKIDLTDTVS
jgi:hypothetical protein